MRTSHPQSPVSQVRPDGARARLLVWRGPVSVRRRQQQLIRVLVVDEHPLVRMGVVALARASRDITVVGETGDAERALALFRALTPDVVLVDTGLARRRGVEVVRQMVREGPRARMIALSDRDGDEDIHQALQAGAHGLLFRTMPAEEVAAAVRTVHAGGRWLPQEALERLAERLGLPELTAREREVLGLVAEGNTNAAIASALGIAPGTVKIHVKAILAKLGAADRTEAAAVALRRGLVHLD